MPSPTTHPEYASQEDSPCFGLTWQSLARLTVPTLLTVTSGCFGAPTARLGMVGAAAESAKTQELQLESVSSRPDAISDGDVLLRISSLRDIDLDSVRIELDGRELAASFRPEAARLTPRGLPAAGRGPSNLPGSSDIATKSRLGLVTGLSVGEHSIEARLDGRLLASLEIRNHPRSGPIFSGPHQRPFVCQTEANLLGTATDEDCSAATSVSYVYRSTDPASLESGEGLEPRARLRDPKILPPGFKPYDAEAPRPADLARATVDGREVDYIVRRERGTINRAVYEIAFLHTPGDPLPTPWASVPGWNDRLVYSFGGGCASGYRQGILPNALEHRLLESGYAIAASSLNVFGNTCNDVISAETASMVREHFIEQFGVPVHTIGRGSSGGSMQQLLIAQNYPGLLDGITMGVSFPDHLAVFASSADCSLLSNAFEQAELTFDDEQKRAVSGFPTWAVCARSWTFAGLQRSRCSDTLPKELHYDADENPNGARCTTHDNMANLFGVDPDTGAAYRPLDNVGVQYGLGALRAGVIDMDRFLELNEKIGGHDSDGNIVATRTTAKREALRAAYRGGRINSGAGSLGRIPIIDFRDYRDPLGDIHDSYRSFVTRARIVARSGRSAEHYVLLRLPTVQRSPSQPRPERPFDSVQLMDEWLTSLAGDRSRDDRATQLLRARPSELSDACFTADGEKILEPASPGDGGRCGKLYPSFSDPRIVAGAPWTDDVLKCQLREIDPTDYPGGLTPAQTERLRRIFPDGVCNYGVPGVEQPGLPEEWARY